jgi:hypothetical protein
MRRHLALAHSDKRRRPYWKNERLLGKSFMDRQSEAVLIIGKDTYTRQEVIDKLHLGNFAACGIVSKMAAKLQVDSLAQLTTRYTMEDLLAERGFGEISTIVLMAAEEDHKRNPYDWLNRKPDDIVTLSTEKHRARKKHEEEGKARQKEAVRRSTARVTRKAG